MTTLLLQDAPVVPDVLYHGTSSRRWAQIRACGCLKTAPVGIPSVSMSRDPAVAAYFADNAASADGAGSTPVVLVVDARRLLGDGHSLEPFSDPVWGPGQCDWEQEFVSWKDVARRYVTDVIDATVIEQAVPA